MTTPKLVTPSSTENSATSVATTRIILIPVMCCFGLMQNLYFKNKKNQGIAKTNIIMRFPVQAPAKEGQKV